MAYGYRRRRKGMTFAPVQDRPYPVVSPVSVTSPQDRSYPVVSPVTPSEPTPPPERIRPSNPYGEGGSPPPPGSPIKPPLTTIGPVDILPNIESKIGRFPNRGPLKDMVPEYQSNNRIPRVMGMPGPTDMPRGSGKFGTSEVVQGFRKGIKVQKPEAMHDL